jgi:hypothetical protein
MAWGGTKEAAATHDRFNLYAVTPLVILTLASYTSTSQLTHEVLSYATLTYVVCDILYNLAVPQCQPNLTRWATIMLHHVVTVWLVLHPCLHRENADMTAGATIVEINTLILTVNRNLKWKSLTYAFYFTWVTMRLIWYPYLTYVHHVRMTGWGAKLFDYYYNQTIGTVVVLCALNWLWTYEVVSGLLAKKPKQKQ